MEKREKKYVRRTSKNYSESFKLQIVADYESGYGSLASLSRKYGIQGRDTLLRWLRKKEEFIKKTGAFLLLKTPYKLIF